MLKPISIVTLINYAFQYVVDTSLKYNIDESHALKHSMEVFGYAKQNYELEIIANPFLSSQKEIIFMAAIGHDMCDKKYMNEQEGVLEYQKYLSNYMTIENLDIMGQIIETMSYSKTKKNGFPELNNYQLAYNIVREADLLSAYDIDRCIIYGMYHEQKNYQESLLRAFDLFDNRVFNMIQDKLFLTSFGKSESLKLHNMAKIKVQNLRTL
jgi:hypothetical protein